jgi:hypothetical protein
MGERGGRTKYGPVFRVNIENSLLYKTRFPSTVLSLYKLRLAPGYFNVEEIDDLTVSN